MKANLLLTPGWYAGKGGNTVRQSWEGSLEGLLVRERVVLLAYVLVLQWE